MTQKELDKIKEVPAQPLFQGDLGSIPMMVMDKDGQEWTLGHIKGELVKTK